MVPASSSALPAATSLPPGMGMRYFAEILDRKTGELISVDKGEWITLAELAQFLNTGRRQMTTVLREMDFIQLEGTGKNCRHRLRDWVLAAGWGKRNRRKSDNMPFDVVSPQGVHWVLSRWQGAKIAVDERRNVRPVNEARQSLLDFQTTRNREGMAAQEQACWLADHFPTLSHHHIADALDVSRQLVDRFMKARHRHLTEARRLHGLHRTPGSAVAR